MVGDSVPSRSASKVRAASGDLPGEIVNRDGWKASVAVDTPDGPLDLPAPPPSRKRNALIIGVNHARGGSPLPGSITDAKHLRDSLLGYGFLRKNVTMLLDGKASQHQIRRELARLADRTPVDGIAVFAVATHTRKRGGQNEFLTGDGLRISASELGHALGKVRSKMWVALPTCYAAGYAVPGIIGKNRIVTFASSSTQPTYQLGDAGSYLFINMVRKAMLEGAAPGSVERSFRFAKETLEREAPDRVPTISDGIAGELVLGRMSLDTIERHQNRIRAQERSEREEREEPKVVFGTAKSAPDYDRYSGPDPEPTPTPSPRRSGVKVCGRFDYRCAPPPSPTPSP
jgi:hypothetical protein